jgi:hypothetical protein
MPTCNLIASFPPLCLQATPLLLTLAVVELSDIAFAVSIPPTFRFASQARQRRLVQSKHRSICIYSLLSRNRRLLDLQA